MPSDVDSEDRKEKRRRDKKEKEWSSKKKKRRVSDSDDSSEDEKPSHSKSKHHKHKRHSKDGERRSKDRDKEGRRHKKESSKKESSSRSKKHGKEDEEERSKRRLLKEAKKLLKGAQKAAKDPEPSYPVDKITKISEDDYFAQNVEFSTWLKESRKTYFNNLTAEEAREHFKVFVEHWNTGRLGARFYEGEVKQAPRTGYTWAVKGRGETVLTDPAEEEDRKAERAAEEKRAKKHYNKEQELVLDELLPKATGREAMMEKKAIRREQAKTREDSPEMKERDIMGGGDDFQQRLARERQWREKKNKQKADVAAAQQSAYQEKEDAKMQAFRNLVAGGKISIPKRDPT